MSHSSLRLALVGAVVLSAAACGGSAGSPAPTATPRPTPTPVGDAPTPTPGRIVVGSPFDAGTLVVASNPLFEGVAPRMEDMIGQDRYWVATPLDGGRYRIDVTIGWGDCPAGCIDKHIWTYEVWPDGSLELVSEVGPELPPDLR
jgi:hypothetical protein